MAISFSYLSMVLTFYRKISEFRSGNPQWYDVWILLGGGFILALYPFMILTIFQENKTSEFKHSKKLQQKFESSIYQDVIMNEVIRPKNKFHYLKFWLFRVSFILIPIVAKGKPCIQWILL